MRSASDAAPGGANADAAADAQAGLLGGDPASPAVGALDDILPVPAADADIENEVIMTKLDVWLAEGAAVGQVNAALTGIGASIASMSSRGRAFSVVFARASDTTALEQKRQALEASPGILLAELARTASLPSLPPAPADAPENIGHLFASKFPAAWNVSSLATKNCDTRKVNFLVVDYFGFFFPETFDSEVPGFVSPSTVSEENHGWKVTSVAIGNFASGVITGANPFTQCLNARGAQAANLSAIETTTLLAHELPTGKVVVNVSLGHSPTPTCVEATCVPSDFVNGSEWLPYGIESAAHWREIGSGRDDDV